MEFLLVHGQSTSKYIEVLVLCPFDHPYSVDVLNDDRHHKWDGEGNENRETVEDIQNVKVFKCNEKTHLLEQISHVLSQQQCPDQWRANNNIVVVKNIREDAAEEDHHSYDDCYHHQVHSLVIVLDELLTVEAEHEPGHQTVNYEVHAVEEVNDDWDDEPHAKSSIYSYLLKKRIKGRDKWLDEVNEVDDKDVSDEHH